MNQRDYQKARTPKKGETRKEYSARMRKLEEKMRKQRTQIQLHNDQKREALWKMKRSIPGSDDYWGYKSWYHSELSFEHDARRESALRRAKAAEKRGDKKAAEKLKQRAKNLSEKSKKQWEKGENASSVRRSIAIRKEKGEK